MGNIFGILLILVMIYKLFLSVSAPGASSLEWWRSFGGRAVDAGYSVQQTSDGSYITVGFTLSYGAGDGDVWLIKIDANGNKIWEKAFDAPEWDEGYENYWDIGRSVQQTSDGGYIIVGDTFSHIREDIGVGHTGVWVIKTDADGNKVWDKIFAGEREDIGYSVQQTSDGGYIIVGETRSRAGDTDVWLIKTDSSGNKEWDKTFGGASFDSASSVQQTSDGGYIIVGYTASWGAGRPDIWLIKTDSNGSRVWDKTFGGISYDYGRSVQQTLDGGYIITGETGSYGAGWGDVWLIKTDSGGNKVWDKTFGGTASDVGNSVQQTSDGGYIIVGKTCSYGGTDSCNVWLVKTDSDGDKVWDKAFGGERHDIGHSVQETSDGGYIIAGETRSYGAGLTDLWLLKVRAGGNNPPNARSYDEDDSGYIEIGELLHAVSDYIVGKTTISQVLQVINLYINHTHR